MKWQRGKKTVVKLEFNAHVFFELLQTVNRLLIDHLFVFVLIILAARIVMEITLNISIENNPEDIFLNQYGSLSSLGLNNSVSS